MSIYIDVGTDGYPIYLAMKKFIQYELHCEHTHATIHHKYTSTRTHAQEPLLLRQSNLRAVLSQRHLVSRRQWCQSKQVLELTFLVLKADPYFSNRVFEAVNSSDVHCHYINTYITKVHS